jgi:fumarate hydratase class II
MPALTPAGTGQAAKARVGMARRRKKTLALISSNTWRREGTEPNLKQISNFVERSLMLVTALSPVIGYDKASQVGHYALDHDMTLKEAALKLGTVSAAEFDRIVDPRKMVKPYVAVN